MMSPPLIHTYNMNYSLKLTRKQFFYPSEHRETLHNFNLLHVMYTSKNCLCQLKKMPCHINRIVFFCWGGEIKFDIYHSSLSKN